MYYLKYRPQKLADIDNKERQMVLKSVFTGKMDIPHAYLLVGPKGTGKTSTARIIAKILNCENNVFAGQGTTIEPCNSCDNCRDITSGRFLDVYELDGASNRSIDDVRLIREQVGYAPVKGRYKIYIIDEVHMLTKEAFNALLKTLEEPPSFVVFILATTEAHKLPGTISSRCISIAFEKAHEDELVESLRRICTGEKLTVSDETLQLIAKRSGGSFRDAAKTLEFLVHTKRLEPLSAKQALQSHMVSSPSEFLTLLSVKKQQEALSWLSEYEQKGGAAVPLIEELLNDLHDRLLSKQGIAGESSNKTHIFSSSEIARLVKLLLEAYRQSKFTPIDMLPLMIAVVEYGE